MRSGGGCAVQQALTPEAATVVKQAAVLAKRRGHAQVTPLHVANTMLAGGGGGGGGLLRAACLRSQSHSHPLQCKALELCFNVALNRLPSSASDAIFGHRRSHYPSLSNALIAAFKRAQAHHRRGAAPSDNPQHHQQQQILTVKIELDQLIISILDDPSVSRVMREAGFSSTQVKINVEKASKPKENNNNLVSNLNRSSPKAVDNAIIEALATSKRWTNLAVVGETTSDAEAAVKEVMDRSESEGRLHESLKELKFIPFPPFHTFCNVGRETVVQKVEETRFLVKSHVGKGVVVYVGDLEWISEYRFCLERERRCYCSVEHVIMEVGRMVSEMNGEFGRVWLMAIASFQTYMKCRNGYNSLDMLWGFHPVMIPANSFGLSLLSHSDNENGAQKLQSRQPKPIEITLTLSSASPSSSNSGFSFDQHNPNLQQTHLSLNSPSSADTVDAASPPPQKFKEFNARNLNTICNLLEKKVPWQREIIPEISGTILQCRSGMSRRQRRDKQETWLFFLGPDARAKEAISMVLADAIFGSCNNFVSVETDDRVGGAAYGERFAGEVSRNPRRVFLLKDLERVDWASRVRIGKAIERGRVCGEKGEEFCLFDAIVVLSCERFGSGSSPPSQEIGGGGGGVGSGSGGVGLDLNLSVGDESGENMQWFDDLGILENVDRLVVFKMQD